MAETNPGRNLDWKKVFKSILLKEEEALDNSMAEASDVGANFEPEVEKNELCSFEQEHDLSSEFSEVKNEQSTCSINTSESLTNEKNSLTLEPELEFNPHISGSSPFYFKKSEKVPKWNEVFKEILGDKQSKEEFSEKSNNLPQMQDGIKPLSQEQDAENKYGARRKQNCSSPGYKEDPEETKVRKLFASWARMKPFRIEYNLNDFDGAGINIFKDRKKKDALSYPIRSHSGDLKSSNLSKYSDKPYEKDVPLTGVVAVNRCTKADIQKNRKNELSEVWDDDLLF